MNEERKKEFAELCVACENEPVWRAGILDTMRDMLECMRVMADNSKKLYDVLQMMDSRILGLQHRMDETQDG